MDSSSRPGRLSAARVAGVVVALVAVGWTLSRADLGRVAALLGGAGPLAATALVPYALALALDALAWQALARPIARVPFGAFYRVRLRCDAFASTLPGGTLIAESIAPAWLRGVMPVETGVAVIAGRKCVVGVAEGVYMLAGTAAGFGVLRACGRVVPTAAMGAACAMLLLFGGTAAVLGSGSVAARVHRGLTSVPIAPLRRALAPHAASFARADERMVALFRSRGSLAASCAIAIVAWSVEAVETWWLLHLVGLDLPFAAVFALEANVSLLRSVGSFAPGGLGVQDLGYVAVLQANGVPHALDTGAAFLLLKRGKELAWAAVGYATLATARSDAVASAIAEPARTSAA